MPAADIRLILVCGIPGSGKSTFCEWLEREKGFIHLDFDFLLREQGTQEKLSTIAPLLRSDLDNFVSGVRKAGRSVAIDWGFPIASLGAVRLLKQKGFVPWWFDGDREAAHEAFTRRGTVSLEALQVQMAAIERHWADIKRIIESNVIDAVLPGPKHRPPDWIFGQMFSTDGSQ
jgi:cytidylate kinase